MTRRFGDVVAVNDASLWVGAGTIVGLIGPSGSGKTTMVRMLTGTLAPTSGRVAVLGETPAHFRRETRERLGYMPQQFHLYPHLTTSENVAFCATLFGLFWWHRRKRVREVLELVQLTDARNRLAKDLSGGQQRRLSLACALVHEPDVLFVDEPTAGLDPLLRQTVWDEFGRLRDAGRTLFVTTQTVSDAQYCDGVAMLVKGTLVAVGEPAALKREVFGGELVDIRTEGPAPKAVVESVQGVRAVQQPAKDRLLVTTDDAGVVVPLITSALNTSGSRVITADKHEPTYDEVFVELVERTGAGEREEVAS
ncbi:MAG TPA: ABC transporter ATP-binding protein [Candidatus Acidoferrales bacterium]|nr:ABC transporter ATP-binding protein [Candidatus Acidoferrales bacterium]